MVSYWKDQVKDVCDQSMPDASYWEGTGLERREEKTVGMKSSEESDAAAVGWEWGVGAEGMLHLVLNRHYWLNDSVRKDEKENRKRSQRQSHYSVLGK